MNILILPNLKVLWLSMELSCLYLSKSVNFLAVAICLSTYNMHAMHKQMEFMYTYDMYLHAQLKSYQFPWHWHQHAPYVFAWPSVIDYLHQTWSANNENPRLKALHRHAVTLPEKRNATVLTESSLLNTEVIWATTGMDQILSNDITFSLIISLLNTHKILQNEAWRVFF